MFGVTTSIGAISSLAAVVIILVAKGYKEFVYRLLLYMAVDNLIGFPICVADKFQGNRHGLTIPTALFFSYFIFVYLFLLCWLGLYLFLLAVSRIQIKKIKHEAIGLVIVLVTPFTFLWIFPWKKIALCDNTHNLKEVKVYWLTSISFLLAILLSCLFTGAVLIILCKKAVTRVENNTLQQQYRKAVRETIPFVVFVITHQVFSIELASVSSYQKYITAKNKELPFLVWEAIDIWPLCAISLPLLLLSQSRIRLAIKCKNSPKNIPYSGYFSRGSIFAVVRIFVLLKIFAILILAEPRIHDLCTFRRADDRWRQFRRMPVFEATMCTERYGRLPYLGTFFVRKSMVWTSLLRIH